MASAEEITEAIERFRAACQVAFQSGLGVPPLLQNAIDAAGHVADFAESFLADPPECACGDYHWTCDDRQDQPVADAEVAEAIADAQGTTFAGGGVIRGYLDCREEGRHLWDDFADQGAGSTVECPRCHTTRFKPLGGGHAAYGGAPGWPVRRT